MREYLRRTFPLFKSLWLLLAWVPVASQADQSWSLLTSASYATGQYIYDSTIENYYLNFGTRYRTPEWTMTVSFPLLAQKNNVFVNQEDSSMPTSSNLSYTPGDLYLFVERIVWRGLKRTSVLAASVQTKIPVGLANAEMSSGKLDIAGNVAFRQSLGKYNAFVDLGHLDLGDPENVKYQDPLSFGIGFGRIYKDGKYSTSIYYKAYSEILSGIIPPRQVTLGWYYRLNAATYISLYLAQGLSESSPDQSMSIGLSTGL